MAKIKKKQEASTKQSSALNRKKNRKPVTHFWLMTLNKLMTFIDCWLWRKLLRWRHRRKIAAWATTVLIVLGAAAEPCLNHDKSCGYEENRLQTGSRRKRISFQTSLQYTHDIKTYSLISFATTHRQQRVVMFKMSIIEDQVSDIPSLRKLNWAYQQLSLVSKLVFSVGHIIHEEENRIEDQNSSLGFVGCLVLTFEDCNP